MDPVMSIFEDEELNELAGDNISGESNTTTEQKPGGEQTLPGLPPLN